MRRVFGSMLGSFHMGRAGSLRLVVAALMLTFVFMLLSPLRDACIATGYAVSPAVIPFMFENPIFQSLVAFGVLLLFSNAPFISPMQMFVISRTGRRRWVVGQILYVLLATGIYLLVILLFGLICVCDVATLSTNGWGKIATTLAATNMGTEFGIGFDIPRKVIETWDPVFATVARLAVEYLGLALVGLTVFAANLYIKRMAGLYLGGAICLADIVIQNTLPYAYVKASPLSLARLQNLSFSEGSLLYPTYDWALAFSAALVLLVIVFAIAGSSRVVVDASLHKTGGNP